MPEFGPRRIDLGGTDWFSNFVGAPLPVPGLRGLRRLWRAIGECQVIVFTDILYSTSIAAWLFAYLRGKPVLLAHHVAKPVSGGRIGRLLSGIGDRLLVPFIARRVHAAAYVSDVVAKHFASTPPRIESRTIYNGIDTQLFHPSADAAYRRRFRQGLGLHPDRNVVGFVGRLVSIKGVETVAALAARRPDCEFACAGDGNLSEKLPKLANLHLLGSLDRVRLADFYRVCDCLILPSERESFSLVVREALATGIPVLCGDQIRETDAMVGQYVRTVRIRREDVHGNAERLDARLDECFVVPDSERSAAREYVVANFDWDAVAARYLDLIDSVVDSER